MSRKLFSINYKESQIIKHALENGINDKKKALSFGFGNIKEVYEEEKLLQRVKEFVEEYKRYIEK